MKHPTIILSAILLLTTPACAQVPASLTPRVPIASAAPMVVSPDAVAAPPTEGGQPKSRLLAIAYSLLLPGMGELYAGRFDRGLHPLIVEGVLWLGFAGFNSYGNWLQTDSRTYAVQHAGASIDGKDDQFFVDVANYMNTHDYNQAKLVDRNLAALYSEDAGSAWLWQWSSDAERRKYKDQRTLSEEMFNASRFVVLGMIANRIWSAIQASIFTRDYNAALAPQTVSVRTRLTSHLGRTDGLRMDVSVPF